MKGKSTLIGLLVLFLAGLSMGVFHTNYVNSDSAPLNALIAHATPLHGNQDAQVKRELGTFAKLARDLKPSVVGISVVKQGGPAFNFPGARSPDTEGQGSGVIISADGQVVTNNHVVEGAKEIRVKLQDGRELKARVAGTDANTDLALLRVESDAPLPAARLGSSKDLAVGDWVMAIGNPFGLAATVTVGVLSGKGRVIGAGPYDDFLQTDASINPGNSGGPLFNTAGEVVGINTAIVKGGQGIGFAIPIDLAQFVVGQLDEKGRVVRGFVGLGIQALTPSLRRGLDLPPDLQGALVSSVVEGGPADLAGAQLQDVVVAIDGHPVSSDRELLDRVARTPVGTHATLTIFRDGKERQLRLTIGERPDQPELSQSGSPEPKDSEPRLGVRIQDVTPAVGRHLGLEDFSGVVVVDVLPGTPADRSGIQPGDVIHQVGKYRVEDSREFLARLKAEPGDLALLVERQGRTVFVVVN